MFFPPEDVYEDDPEAHAAIEAGKVPQKATLRRYSPRG